MIRGRTWRCWSEGSWIRLGQRWIRLSQSSLAATQLVAQLVEVLLREGELGGLVLDRQEGLHLVHHRHALLLQLLQAQRRALVQGDAFFDVIILDYYCCGKILVLFLHVFKCFPSARIHSLVRFQKLITSEGFQALGTFKLGCGRHFCQNSVTTLENW